MGRIEVGENRDAALHEAARIALVRFIEERAAGIEYAQGDKGCRTASGYSWPCGPRMRVGS